MIEELTIAIEELRQRPTDRIWFVPVRLDECEIPDIDIGRGETLHNLQYVSLYEDWNAGIQSILNVIQPQRTELALDGNTVEKRYAQNKQHIESDIQDYLASGFKENGESSLDDTRRDMGLADWFSTFCSNIQVQNSGTISTRYQNITRRLPIQIFRQIIRSLTKSFVDLTAIGIDIGYFIPRY